MIASSGTSRSDFRFAGAHGYVSDHELTGLDMLGQRYYVPGIGRFLTRDPIGYEGGINLYAYTENNPISGVDPLGMSTLFVIGSFSGLPEFARTAYVHLMKGAFLSGDEWVENPTREHLMGLLASGKFDRFSFGGHGDGATGALNLITRDSGVDREVWFYMADLDKIIHARNNMGMKKMKSVELYACGSTGKGEFINKWLELSDAVTGFPGLSCNVAQKKLNDTVTWTKKTSPGLKRGFNEGGGPKPARRKKKQ